MKCFIVPLVGMLLMTISTSSQEAYRTAVAESGDGIFSILRKEGINPSKYYADFVSLNESNIKNGSELHVGREYKLPNAPDSFKSLGKHIVLPTNIEKEIFDDELSKMTFKSDKLKDAVYYLIAEDNVSNKETKKFTDDITKDLAKRLLENGAKVYVIEKEISTDEIDKLETTQAYIDIINKRFLRNTGKYQRLLVVRTNGLIGQLKTDVSIYHHNKSVDGERFASNIQSVLNRNNINKIVVKDNLETFEDQENLFLAKNMLPALTIVEIGNTNIQKNKKALSVRPDKKALAKWLSSGIFKDYADVEVEE